MKHLKIFYISNETALNSHSNMKKTWYKFNFQCLHSCGSGKFYVEQLYRIPLIDLA